MMSMFDNIKNKVTDAVEGAVDKVGDTIDDKTGGKFSDHIDKVQDKVHGATGGDNEAEQA
jgi:hypothetical protein